MITTEYLITALIMALIPGTGVIYTLNTALVNNTKYGLAASVGCTLGIVPHITACVLGLSAIMQLGAQIFMIIKYAGVVYLCYLAFMTWKNAGTSLGNSNIGTHKGYFETAKRAVFINLLNPKLTIFFLSFIPQYLPVNSSNTTADMILLSLVFMLITFIVFAGYAIAAGAVSSFIRQNKKVSKWIERGFACIFAGFAVKLALQDK